MMSVLAAVAAVAVAVTFAWFGWWDDIFGYLGGLDIRINTAGYLCVGVPLFVAWLAVLTVYDRQHYVVFGRGQIRYVQEGRGQRDGDPVGGGECGEAAERRVPPLGPRVGDRGSGHPRRRAERADDRDEQCPLGGRKMAVIDRLLREKAVTVD
jgi:hypothetical protein